MRFPAIIALLFALSTSPSPPQSVGGKLENPEFFGKELSIAGETVKFYNDGDVLVESVGKTSRRIEGLRTPL